MILVDTSVWIEFFRDSAAPEVALLVTAIEADESIAYTGMILQEVLQGCPNQKAVDRIEDGFAAFVEVFPHRSTYRLAARLFRDARKKGLTVRSSVDCLIAACALETGAILLERDRDFLTLQRVCRLPLLRPV